MKHFVPPPTAPSLSVVIPCFNEAGCIDELHRRVTAAAQAIGSYEIILVNDSSKDTTWERMQTLADHDPHLTVVNLSRNHGHQLALTAGLDLCRGKRILIIDADLQDPPELVGPMLETMNEQGADVVYGLRRSREGETAFKRATAKAFYRLLSRATDTEIPVDTGDFRLMSRRALDVLLAMPEQARFIRGMVSWIGFKQVPLSYDRDERYAGETKYPLHKMIRFALDALTGFSSAPLKLASHIGIALGIASIGLIGYIMSGWLSGEAVQGWTSLMLVVVTLGAIQMFVLGLMGEYIGRMYSQGKHRPLYIVSDIKGGAVRQARLGVDASAERPAAMQEESDHRGGENHRDQWPPIGSADPSDQ